MDASAIINSIEAVTKKWRKQRKQEERGRCQTRREALTNRRGPSIKHAAWRVMKEAYLKASDGGKLPASARQIYYAARKQIMEATGKSAINSQYFTQTLLPEYVSARNHQDETATWDITYDARGHFAEPHTDVIVPLGTLDVRGYLADVESHVAAPLAAVRLGGSISRFPTCGPENRFSAVLFIEKEGFMPLFEAVRLAERYDLAIMSTKGMPVVACRHLADELCGGYDIPLLVLHDFDKAGFSILGTLAGDNMNMEDGGHNRYEFRHDFEVIDLGLRLADVRAYDLQSEPVSYGPKSDPTDNLEANGATEEEVAFLCEARHWNGCHGQRVELNAFTSGDFVRWIEAKLQEQGIKKVVPDDETLKAAYRRAVQAEIVRGQLDAIVRQAGEEAQQVKLPAKLDRIVRKGFNADSAQSWDDVITAAASANCKKRASANGDLACTKEIEKRAADAPNCKKRAGGTPQRKQAKKRGTDANLTTGQGDENDRL
jgi:hypothetical protein